MGWFERLRRGLSRGGASTADATALTGVDRVFAELTGAPGEQPLRLPEAGPRARVARSVPRRYESDPVEPGSAVVQVSAVLDPEIENLDLEAYEQRELRRLYAEVIGGHLAPLKGLVSFLRVLPMSREWTRAAAPSLEFATRSASELGLLELCPLLEIVAEQLERCEAIPGPLVDGPPRESFLQAYSDLEAVFPEAFEVDEQEGAEALGLYTELRAISGLAPVQVDRVFRAGLNDLDAFEYAAAGDLALAAGLEADAAERIWRRVQTLRADRSHRVASTPRGPSCPRCGHRLGVEPSGGVVRLRCGRCRRWIRLEPDPAAGLTITVEETEMVPETPYELLGVDPRDPLESIRRAYRQRVAAYHPDKVAQLGEELRDLAESKTRELNVAMETIERARR